MKCPLRTYSYKGAYDQDLREELDCLKEECAWWHPLTQCCAVDRIASNMSTLNGYMGELVERMPVNLVDKVDLISHVLKDIRVKMPHVGQFLK